MAPKNKINYKDRLENGELDLSMSDLQEVPIKDIVSLSELFFNKIKILILNVLQAQIKKATSLDLSNNRLTSLGVRLTNFD